MKNEKQASKSDAAVKQSEKSCYVADLKSGATRGFAFSIVSILVDLIQTTTL